MVRAIRKLQGIGGHIYTIQDSKLKAEGYGVVADQVSSRVDG